MSAGAILLAGIAAAAVRAMPIALDLRSLADRVATGEKVSTRVGPVNPRTIAPALLILTPIMGVIVALMPIGTIRAGGIDPIHD